MPLHEGENVGPYRVIGQLGQGGMATVYKAFHAQLNRYVAIKMMHQAFQENENFHARFRREAQIVALLEHPHIIPVYDFNEHQNQPYLVMKYVEGKTLKGTLVDGALTLEQVLHVMSAVASALTYAHSKGVLHRDIKPSNIVIDGDNVPYLTDFGLARIAEAGESTLSADMIMGTPHYISPEQALGDKNLTSRTDIYSLGVVLYELVVGRVPFSADTPYAIIHDHIYTPLPMPSVVNPDIPASVEMVLLKALSKDPEDRFESAVEMVDAFKKSVSDAGMSELRADRISIAGISLAKLRNAMNSQLIGGATLGVPSPIPVPSATQILRQKQRERRWMWGGIVAFLAICVLSGLISVNAMSTIERLTEDLPEIIITEEVAQRPTPNPTGNPPANNNNSAQNNNQGGGGGGPRPDPPPIPRMNVLELSVEEAEANLAANEDSPEAYLTLAYAYLVDDQRDEARETFQDGIQLLGDPVVYLVTAGDLSRDTEHHELAVILYGAALTIAQDGRDPATAAAARSPFNPIRIEFGQYLYELTEEEGAVDFGTITIAINARGSFAQIDPTFIEIFATRDFVQAGRGRLAITRIEEIANQPNTFAEAHLIYGEALLADGSEDEALEQWEMVLRDPFVPEWAYNRAQELIATTEE
jgi:serine/threonine protein kinase